MKIERIDHFQLMVEPHQFESARKFYFVLKAVQKAMNVAAQMSFSSRSLAIFAVERLS